MLRRVIRNYRLNKGLFSHPANFAVKASISIPFDVEASVLPEY